MQGTIYTTLIATGGVIGGSLITATAAAYSARQKVRELRVQYELKLHESYLANARQYTNAVYVPLSIELERLRTAYEDLRASATFDNADSNAQALASFRDAMLKNLSAVELLMSRGADAFMTLALEDALRAFTSFVRNSIDVKEERRRIVLEIGGSRFETEISGRVARLLGRPAKLTTFWGSIPRWSYDAEEILAAPPSGRIFEACILKIIRLLKRLIKEVTLGAHVDVSAV